MYKVGIIDDTDELLDDYKVRLKRKTIELVVAPEGSMEDIKEWIVQEKIKCILIDYQLSSKYDFNGTELAFYLEDTLQGMPYLILTSYREDSIDEKIVVKNAICDRNVMDKTGDEFNDFCEQLKQMTEVFDNTLKKYKEKYAKILKVKNYDELRSAYTYDMFSLWTEINARAKGYYFVRKYTQGELLDSEVAFNHIIKVKILT